MSIYALLGILSPLICAVGYVPYIAAMAKKKITPHPFSWLLWAILGFVSLVTYIGVGAKVTLPLAIMNFAGPTLIFFFTIKYWKEGFSRVDYLCLAFSLVSILTYVIFHRAAIALTINLAGDLFAALPTVRKTWIDPSSENFLTWFCFAIGAMVSLVALDGHFSYGVTLLPLYLASFETLMVLLVLRGRLKKSR